jgi:hypothetical protein
MDTTHRQNSIIVIPIPLLLSSFTLIYQFTCCDLSESILMQNMATSSTTKSGKTLDPKVRVLQIMMCVWS